VAWTAITFEEVILIAQRIAQSGDAEWFESIVTTLIVYDLIN